MEKRINKTAYDKYMLCALVEIFIESGARSTTYSGEHEGSRYVLKIESAESLKARKADNAPDTPEFDCPVQLNDLLNRVGEIKEADMIDRLLLELSGLATALTNKEAIYRREPARLQELYRTLRAEAFALLENDDTKNVYSQLEVAGVIVKDAV